MNPSPCNPPDATPSGIPPRPAAQPPETAGVALRADSEDAALRAALTSPTQWLVCWADPGDEDVPCIVYTPVEDAIASERRVAAPKLLTEEAALLSFIAVYWGTLVRRCSWTCLRHDDTRFAWEPCANPATQTWHDHWYCRVHAQRAQGEQP